MRIAIQNPGFVFADQSRNFDGYNFEFLRQFRHALYLPGWKNWVSRGWKWRAALGRAGLDPDEYRLLFSEAELRREADVLLCFNQIACLPGNRPPRNFHGLKIWHVMDFNYRAPECYRALREGGVDAVMAYTALDRHCSFFREFYPEFIGRTIPVPFGFGARFQVKKPFAERIQKVVAMGAIHPMDQGPAGAVLREYLEYYRAFPFSQMWRAELRSNEQRLAEIMDSFLPHPPQASRPGDDPVKVLNEYALYANDDSVCHFPPARTYEGAASGAVMVAGDHECFRELGFADGENCILHRRMDLDDFEQKTKSWLARPAELEELARRGSEMVRERYSHPAVAAKLHAEIRARWKG